MFKKANLAFKFALIIIIDEDTIKKRDKLFNLDPVQGIRY